ncbi:hypothetical protein GGR56DRAFT_513072 [Xylariaceae sp. FL0804]|nr:hypothetical protein GGR56DRAFT_513072 [Xylariaceae sp. FL0804]
MASKYGHGVSANGSANGYHTVTALSRWSIARTQLPAAADKIKTLHIYDFDNTLFQTPLPNPKLWNTQTLGQLGSPDIFVNGGWWHDSRILAATGEGAEQEEARAWRGWWNEKIVELVRLSMQQKDALCVLLTGRSEKGFSDLIRRIVDSKGLEFDLIGLKPEVGPNSEHFRSTMLFKQAFLEATMETYRQATEIRIYEDRIKHVNGFRDFMANYNERRMLRGPATRPPIAFEVIQVADISTTLDPVVEVAEVQHLINSHNAIVGERPQQGNNKRLIIRKMVFFTGYMMKPEDTKKLIALNAPSLPHNDIKYHANAIIIAPRACPKHILDKVGGLNSKMKWETTELGSLDNGIWAVAVEPVPRTTPYHTDPPKPKVVLGTRKNARPSDAQRIYNWAPLPPDRVFTFETTVGEKVVLKIEPEDGYGNNNNNDHDSFRKRKFTGDDDKNRGNRYGNHHNNNQHHYNNNNNNNRGFHSASRGGNARGGFRGGGGPNRGYRGGGSGRGGRGGSRGGRGGYRSLDDMGTRPNGAVSYDDGFASQPQGGGGGSQSQGSGPAASQYGQSYQPQQGGHWQNQGGNGGPDLPSLY